MCGVTCRPRGTIERIGPSRMSRQIALLDLGDRKPCRNAMVTLWPLARSNGGMRRDDCSTAAVVIRAISAA